MDLFEGLEPQKNFEDENLSGKPLAERLRPRKLEDFIGQEDLIGEGKPLREAMHSDQLPSVIFWGPPGTGKTTLARLIARQTSHFFVAASAVMTGVKEARDLILEAKRRKKIEGRGTIFFLDEIHRWNKAQQDAFLPHIEDGTIILIGSTTENPSFEVNSALLSRCQVFVFKPLQPQHLREIIRRALEDETVGLGKYKPELTPEAYQLLLRFADGDARRALNALEGVVQTTRPDADGKRLLTETRILEALQRKSLRYDKAGEEHYDIISAFHKCLRDSDTQAAIYWLARMLAGGEDPLYIVRRMIRFASEDIGLADPQALTQTLAAKDAVHFLGQPEGELALYQATVYLATAPKSNAVYVAEAKAKRQAEHGEAYPVPLNIRNAPTKLMKEIGYGKDYVYAHDTEEHFTVQQHLPPELDGTIFYTPGKFGFEKDIKARLDYWHKLIEQHKTNK